MPSWVAPALAAEYLNRSEDEIWHLIHTGQIPVRREGDFYFVDVALDASPPQVVEVIPLPWVEIRRQAAARRRAPAKAA
jgi:hypothetical protein